MDKTQVSLTERAWFLICITMQGGFLDAYTYVTRDGMLCTMHTGNMAKFGIFLAQGNFPKAISFFIPILACVFGSFTSEVVKHHAPKGQDWRKTALLLEMLALIAVGFVPAGVASVFVTTFISYISGFQFSLFRKSQWGVHNTAVCTGNLRSIGGFLYAAVSDRTGESWYRLLSYICITFSFVFGAAIGIPICTMAGPMSSLFGAAIAAVLFAAMAVNDKKALQA